MDEELQFERAKRDQAAFRPLYDLYYPQIYGFAIGWLRNHHEAQDATSEIFKRIWFGRDSFHGGSLRNWIFSIAVNHLRDITKAKRPSWQLEESLIDAGANPESQAMHLVGSEALHKAILQLDPLAQAVVLMMNAGYRSKEVARLLGRTDTWVRTTHYRALHRLKTILESNPDGGERDA